MTPDHPFRMLDGGWVAADKLEPGDLVEDLKGAGLKVRKKWSFTDKATSCNFEVGDYHTLQERAIAS